MELLPPPTPTRYASRWLCVAAWAFLSVRAAQAQSPGTQDTTFADGTAADGAFYALSLQSNGQVLVGGSFNSFRGASRNALARLNTDGSLDSFSPGLAFSGYNGALPTIQAVAVQADGKILAAGSFSVPGQPAGGGVVRLNTDGSLDAAFNAGTGVVDDGGQVGTAYALAVLPGGQILVGGAFQTFNGVGTAGLVRLNADGSVDTAFNPGGAGIAANGYGQDVRSIVALGNGTVVIGGHFSAYDGQSAGGVARLNADGTPDPGFNVAAGVDGDGVNAVAVQGDGKVLAGGGSSNFDGYLVRLNTDGSLDTSYDMINALLVAEVDALLVQPDGTVLAGGVVQDERELAEGPHNGLARFLADGKQDLGFDSGRDSRQVVAMALQSDGQAVVASNAPLIDGGTGDAYRYTDLVATPAFFDGEVALDNGVYSLTFPSGNPFGYYSFLTNRAYIYHFDLGYEYVFDAADGNAGVYLYDFKSSGFFYTSPGFPFPYLYDFNLGSTVYYYPDPNHAGYYNTNGVRYFYVFNTGKIISK